MSRGCLFGVGCLIGVIVVLVLLGLFFGVAGDWAVNLVERLGGVL